MGAVAWSEPGAGANIKTLQRMLGHASAALTLDRYGHLFDDDLDTVADSMDVLYRPAIRAGHLPDIGKVALTCDLLCGA